jgi:hypothetical protein
MDNTEPLIVEQEKFKETKTCGKNNTTNLHKEHCDKEATCSCGECEEIFCLNCFERQHTSKKLKTHQKINALVSKPKCVNHPLKPSEVFCFDDNCCLCSACALLKHKDHHVSELYEATETIQDEMEALFSDEEITKAEDSIEEIIDNISKRNNKHQMTLEQLKYQLSIDLSVFEELKLEKKEKLNTLNTLKEMKEKLKNSNILELLKIKDEFKLETSESYKEVYSFGRNDHGSLGHGDTEDKKKPKLIQFFKDKKIKNIASGGEHTIVTTGNF